MIPRDERCVHVVDNPYAAHVVVAFLAQHDIDAAPMGIDLSGLTEALPGLGKTSLRGIEIWVRADADISRAKELLRQHTQALQATARPVARGPITVTCERCGSEATFPPTDAGRTQDCRKCGAYIDVPDGSDDEEQWWADEAE